MATTDLPGFIEVSDETETYLINVWEIQVVIRSAGKITAFDDKGDPKEQVEIVASGGSIRATVSQSFQEVKDLIRQAKKKQTDEK